MWKSGALTGTGMDDQQRDGQRPVEAGTGTGSGPGDAPAADRRRVLRLGAAGAAALVSIRPALAQTHASVLACDIPVPDAARAGSYIAADGTPVPAGTAGAFPPPGHPLKGEDVRRALAEGGTLPGVDGDRGRAYLNYVRRLQRGTGGFTCFASLQMPRG